MSILTWLLNSRVGQAVMAGGAAIAALLVIVMKAFSAGKTSAEAKHDAAALAAMEEKGRSDAAVNSLTPDGRRDRLRTWSRD